MLDWKKFRLVLLLLLLNYPEDNLGGSYEPRFRNPLENITVPLGREAVFTCHVDHLGSYKVGWVKADTKAIQAIHDHVITHNKRISVQHVDHVAWSLHIKGVQLEDEGLYMCQINTDPMKSQTGMLTVNVSPDFLPDETSSDVTVLEGDQVKLKCRAQGKPVPTVSWRREDKKRITIREEGSSNSPTHKARKIQVTEHKGEELRLMDITRHEMGPYLCIASNGIPPAISKRIIVTVQFIPQINVPNQLLGAPLGTDVVLECRVEASPMSINYWTNERGEVLAQTSRHEVRTTKKSPYSVSMDLIIRKLQKQDVGTYHCVAANSLLTTNSSIRLYEISDDFSQSFDGDNNDMDNDFDDEDSFGSADLENLDNRPFLVDNTIRGHIGNPSATNNPSLSTKINKKKPIIVLNLPSTGGASQASSGLIVITLILANSSLRW